MSDQGTGLGGSIYADLESLIKNILGRERRRGDGAVMKIGRWSIEQNRWKTTSFASINGIRLPIFKLWDSPIDAILPLLFRSGFCEP